MFANSDQHLGSCDLEPGTLELIKVAGVYFIAPLSNLPNYGGVKLRSKLPSATAFVKVDRTTAHFTAITLKKQCFNKVNNSNVGCCHFKSNKNGSPHVAWCGWPISIHSMKGTALANVV